MQSEIRIVRRNHGHWDVSSPEGRLFRIRGVPGSYVAMDDRVPHKTTETPFLSIGTCIGFICEQLMHENLQQSGAEPPILVDASGNCVRDPGEPLRTMREPPEPGPSHSVATNADFRKMQKPEPEDDPRDYIHLLALPLSEAQLVELSRRISARVLHPRDLALGHHIPCNNTDRGVLMCIRPHQSKSQEIRTCAVEYLKECRRYRSSSPEIAFVEGIMEMALPWKLQIVDEVPARPDFSAHVKQQLPPNSVMHQCVIFPEWALTGHQLAVLGRALGKRLNGQFTCEAVESGDGVRITGICDEHRTPELKAAAMCYLNGYRQGLSDTPPTLPVKP